MIERLEGGYYVRFNGQLSAVRSPTRSKAEEHQRKLDSGLVQFKPLDTCRQHNPVRTLPYNGNASNRSRIFPNA